MHLVFTVLDEDDTDEGQPASEDEDKDDQSPRTRLLRGDQNRRTRHQRKTILWVQEER